jgi:hypothetical protein
MASASNIVVNGDFETGDFTGWTQSGNTGSTGVDNTAHSGTFGASFGPAGSLGFLTQTLTTVAGSSYDLNFWLADEGGTQSAASVTFDGKELLSMTDPGGFGYQLFSYSVVASGATTDLQFAFRQDPAFFHLDDVSVTAAATETPEPATAAVMFLGIGALMIYRKRQSSLQQ